MQLFCRQAQAEQVLRHQDPALEAAVGRSLHVACRVKRPSGTFQAPCVGAPGGGIRCVSAAGSRPAVGSTAFAENWTAKLEYLYLDTGKVSYASGIAGVTLNSQVKDHVIRFGVNYLFH
jgi:hypothetical protein